MLLTDYVDKEILRKVLFFVIFILGLITIVNFVFLLSHKVFIERRAKKIRNLEEKFLKKILEGFATNEIPILKVRSSCEVEAFSNILSSLAINLSGSLYNFIKKIAEKNDLVNFLIKRCYSKNWLVRLEALEKLGILKIPKLKHFYLNLLETERRYYVQLQILLNLSWIADKDCIRAIVSTLNNMSSLSAKFVEYLFSNIIITMREKGKQQDFLQFLDSLLLDKELLHSLKKGIIEACGVAQLYEAKALFLSYFESMDDSLKVSCIRSLGKMSSPEVCVLIKKAYLSKNWVLRAVAVQYVYLCESEDMIKILTDAFHDYNFYVRRSAVLSLCQLRNEARKIIIKIVENSKDSYARDVASYLIERICRDV
jgi:HEAT repeat protein